MNCKRFRAYLIKSNLTCNERYHQGTLLNKDSAIKIYRKIYPDSPRNARVEHAHIGAEYACLTCWSKKLYSTRRRIFEKP